MFDLKKEPLLETGPHGLTSQEAIHTVEQMGHVLTVAMGDEMAANTITAVECVTSPDDYRYRYRRMSFLVRGIVGVAPELMFFDIIRCAVFDELDTLKKQQQQGAWEPVAWRVQHAPKRMLAKVENEDRGWAPGATKDLDNPPSLPQHSKRVWQDDPNLELQVVFADTMGATEEDPWGAAGHARSPMTRYLQTKDPRHLPPSLREERKRSLELLKAFVAYHAAEALPVPEPEPKKKNTGRQPQVA